MVLTGAPTLFAPSKTRRRSPAYARVVAEAASIASNMRHTMAVVIDGDVIGLVRGDDGGAWFLPLERHQWCGFVSYDDLNRKMKAGKDHKAHFSKTTTSWTGSKFWGDLWPCAGMPASGDYSGTAATARNFDNTTPGGLWLGTQPNTSGGETRHLVGYTHSGIKGNNSVIFTGYLYDRVLTYDGCAITTSTTTLTNTNVAQRYISAGQDGLMALATEQSDGGTGATASNLTTMHVTDQLGNTGMALAPGYTMSWVTSSGGGTTTSPSSTICPFETTNNVIICPFLPLPGGVSGVRKIEDFTSSAINAGGGVCLALVKPLALIWTSGTGAPHRVDWSRTLFMMERVYDTACLGFLLKQGSANTSSQIGYVRMAHG